MLCNAICHQINITDFFFFRFVSMFSKIAVVCNLRSSGATAKLVVKIIIWHLSICNLRYPWSTEIIPLQYLSSLQLKMHIISSAEPVFERNTFYFATFISQIMPSKIEWQSHDTFPAMTKAVQNKAVKCIITPVCFILFAESCWVH